MVSGIRTTLEVTDNSGGIRVQCIKVLGKISQFFFPGDRIVVTVKRSKKKQRKKKRKIYDHLVCRGVVIRSGRWDSRFNGMKISFGENTAVLLDRRGSYIASRVHGCVPYELRLKKRMKIILMASTIV